MNNVEVFEDFLKLLKEIHPNTKINQRDETLLRMAINHAYLIKREEIEQLKIELEKLYDNWALGNFDDKRFFDEMRLMIKK